MKAIILAVFFAFAITCAAAPFDGQDQNSAKAQEPRICYCRAPDPLKDAPGYAEALKYAPILWFANDERYFPTLPFFSAFDGVDNDGDNKLDFDDRDEIAPFDPAAKDSAKASWDSLKKWYDSLADSAKRKMTTVFYRKRATSANKIKDILFGDEQLWRRLEKKVKADTSFKKYLDSTAPIAVYEYYFYYVNDEGLQGHPHDLERVFIFVPADSPIPFRIVVGDGHGDATPNNVLVYNMNGNSDFPPNDRYKSHLHILVELGGHSIAPDLKGDGRFDPVVDANWHSENLWGTRDVQAKVGGGATGNYETWMTFPRDSATKFFPPDDELNLPASHGCYRLLPAENFKNLYGLLSNTRQTSALMNRSQSYLPAAPFGFSKQLDKIAARNQKDEGPEKYFLDEQLNFLNEVALGYNPANSATKLLKHRGVSPLAFWTKDLTRDLRTTGIPIHRPHGFALWSEYDKDARLAWKMGLVINPKISRGVFELQAGQTFGSRDAALSALYDWSYRNTWSGYGKISWQRNRPAISDVTMSFGVSFVPPAYILEIRPHDFLRHFRVRLGIIDMGMAERRNSFRLRLKPELQVGLYEVPIAFSNPYNSLKNRRHKIWEHGSYKDEPNKIFKRHLFRPRKGSVARYPWTWRGFGIWEQIEFDRKASLQTQLSWIIPAWDFLPVKLDGILEIHGGWQQLHLGSDFNRKHEKWIFALYYDRYYVGKPFSWYANFSWINNRGDRSRYSTGVGVSVKTVSLLNTPVINKPFDLFHWLKIRFGLRSDFDRNTFRLTNHRLEFQLGLHY